MATKAELAAVRAEMATNAELAALRAEMATKVDLAEVRAEMVTELAAVRAEMATKADLAGVVTTEMLDLRLAAQTADLKGFVHEVVGTAIQAQTRTVLFGMAGIMAGATTLAAALGQLV
jgi:hypothetical protein